MAKKTGKNNAQKAIDDLSSGMADAKNIAADFLNQLNKGGKQSKAILDQIKKQILGAADATKLSADNMKSLIDSQEKLTDGQRKLADIQKTMSGYDGPRFKATGLITQELSEQLSLNNLLQDSSRNLNSLDKQRQIYSEILNTNTNELGEITWQLVKGSEKLNSVNTDISNTATEMLKLKVKEQKAENRLKDISLQKLELEDEIKTGKGDISKLEEEYIKLMYEESDLIENSKSLGNERITIQEKQNALLQEQKALSETLPELQKKQNKLTDAAAIQASGLVPVYKLLNDLSSDQITEQGNIAKQMQEVEKSASSVGTAQFRQVDLTDEIANKLSEQRELEQARSKILDQNNGLSEIQRKEALDLVSANISINQEQVKQYQALQRAAEAYSSVNDKAEQLRDSIMAPVDKLFGIVPSGLSKMLGLDKIQSELKDKLFSSIADGFMNAGTGARGFFSAASAGASTLMASLLPILPILLAIAGVVGLVKLFMDADKEASELAKSLNMSYKEAIAVKGTAVDLAQEMNMVGVSSKEVTKQMIELKQVLGFNIGEMAVTNQAARDLLETSTAMTAQYGMSAEETVNLNSAAAITGTTLAKIGITAEKMGDEFVSSSQIMKDIGKVSKSVLFNFKGNVVALARAVKQARMMGTTLDKMSQIGAGLMDIENSIAAANKARILTGRNINMDAARYFYMTGQTEKMMESIAQQMGSAAEYEKLGPMQRKAYAEALGMSVDQLDEMMAKQKELEMLGYDAAKLEEIKEKAKKGELNLQEELNKLGNDEAKKQLQAIYNEERRAGIQEKLGNTIQKITDLLFKMVEPLLPIVDAFVDSLGDGKGVLSSISTIFSGIGKILGVVVEISMALLKGAWYPISITIDAISGTFEKIGKAVTWIKENIFGIKDATGDAGKAAEETSKTMEVIKGIAMTIGAIIGGWFLLKGLGKAKDALSSMYDSAKGIGTSLKDGFKSLKEGKLPSFGKKKDAIESISDKKIETPEVDTKGADQTIKNTKSFADRLKSAFKSINDTLKAIFKGIGDMFKNIFKFIKDTVKTILDFIKDVLKDILKTIESIGNDLTTTIKSLLTNIGDILVSAVQLIEKVGTQLVQTFGTLISEIAQVISGAGVQLVNSIGDLIGAIISVIQTQGVALVDALGSIGTAVVDNVMKIVNTLLDGLGQAASKLPGILNSLGKAVGAFFEGMSTGLLAFGQAMATPTALFGLPVGLIVLGMAMGLAAAAAIAAPAIAALGPMFEGLAKVVEAIAPVIESLGTAIATVVESIGSAVSGIITSIADSIVKLQDVDAVKILALGGALTALGIGLVALTAGEVVNGLASFFGASPVDTLKELETIDGNKMKVTADGLKLMSDALSNFGNVNTDPIIKSADALDKFNNQVIKGGLADGLNSFLGTDPFAVFTQLAAIDTAKIDTVAKSIALAGTSIESFNQKMSSLEDIEDKGDIIASLLSDIADVEHDEIDALANAIDNLSKSYDSLIASMKNITDDDIARMQQIASATPKDVNGGGVISKIEGAIGGAVSGVTDLASKAVGKVASFFGFEDDETPKPAETTQVAQTAQPIKPIMEETSKVITSTATADASPVAVNSSTDMKNVEALLKELISKVNQPVQLKIGDGPIRDIQSAITLNRSYTANVNGFRV